MTANGDFKDRVRARMKKTGERYTTARTMLLRTAQPPAAASAETPGVFPGYPPPGGLCRDTGAVRALLQAVGVRAAHDGEPLDEAMFTGLCGGVCFLYAVFEYKGWPPMLSVMGRYDTMPDSFIDGGLRRLGVAISVKETSSAAAARKALDEALAAGKPCLCVVDVVGLADGPDGSPMQMEGMMPTVVAVVGARGDDVLLDEGNGAFRVMAHDRLARARALARKARHRLIRIETPAAPVDLAGPVAGAVAATAGRFRTAPYKGFASNFGLAGLEKWQRLLTDAKDRKGWAAVFPEGALAYLALRRAHDGIEHEMTAPAAGRPLYAEFLAKAADLAGVPAWREASQAFERAGAEWRGIVEDIAGCGDPAVEEGCRAGDSVRELLDEVDCPRRAELAAIAERRSTLARQCALPAARAREIYAGLAERLGRILELERGAVEAMEAAPATTSRRR